MLSLYRMNKKWEIKTKLSAALTDINQRRDRIVKTLLLNRGIKTEAEKKEFLFPQDPYSLSYQSVGIKSLAVKKALQRIKQALAQKESIVVYGDYDADGICATAILWETLHSLKAKVMPFIPSREIHGYGLNKLGIDEVKKKFDPRLIITVDNGIVAFEGVEWAKKQGIDVIITDHHQPAKKLPQALSLVCTDQIAGSGVAWFLAKEIFSQFSGQLKEFKKSNSLELACLGTITDMMPVLGPNRSLIKFGIEELQQTQRAGIKALCREAQVEQKEIGTYHVGFIIGPRINAMGRLEDALQSLRLLCTNSPDRAVLLADQLGLTNRQRKQLTETTLEHALESWKQKQAKEKIIIVASSSYNQGIVGLVAGRLVDEYYRPALVISQEDEFSKGSARSIDGFNIIKFLRKFDDLFEDVGGHPMAAGFNLKTENITKLKQKIEAEARKEIKDELLVPRVKIDLQLGFEDLSWELFDQLQQFSPFGLGNPRPVFSLEKAKVGQVKTVGRNGDHLKLNLVNDKTGAVFEAIAFKQGKKAKQLKPGKLIDVCFSLEKNSWNNNHSLQLMVKDLKV